jgi:hypothetical protein
MLRNKQPAQDAAPTSALKCVHPMFLAGIAVFILPFLVWPVGVGDVIPANKAGPCSVPVFLLFVPGEFMIALGLGFSGSRGFELAAARRKAKNDS